MIRTTTENKRQEQLAATRAEAATLGCRLREARERLAAPVVRSVWHVWEPHLNTGERSTMSNRTIPEIQQEYGSAGA